MWLMGLREYRARRSRSGVDSAHARMLRQRRREGGGCGRRREEGGGRGRGIALLDPRRGIAIFEL